jgi:hypothetical protein
VVAVSIPAVHAAICYQMAVKFVRKKSHPGVRLVTDTVFSAIFQSRSCKLWPLSFMHRLKFKYRVSAFETITREFGAVCKTSPGYEV